MSAGKNLMAQATKRQDEERLEARLKVAYLTAMRHSHEGGRVEIHLGSAAIEFLEALADPLPYSRTRAWGFPIQRVENNAAHVAVHVIHDIY